MRLGPGVVPVSRGYDRANVASGQIDESKRFTPTPNILVISRG